MYPDFFSLYHIFLHSLSIQTLYGARSTLCIKSRCLVSRGICSVLQKFNYTYRQTGSRRYLAVYLLTLNSYMIALNILIGGYAMNLLAYLSTNLLSISI